MKKAGLALFICILVFVCAVNARIDVVNNSKDVYYLGDEISGNLVVTGEINSYALLMTYFMCGNKTFTFYAVPVVLKEGEINGISLPAFPVYSGLLGECKIAAQIQEFGGGLLEENEGAVFRISNELKADISVNNTHVKQGGTLEFFITFEKEGSYNISAVFERQDVRVVVFQNFSTQFFSSSFSLPRGIKKGNGNFSVIVYDKNGNNMGETFEIEVNQVIANLSLEVVGSEFKPMDKIGTMADLFDYAGERVEDNISIMLKNPRGEIVENFLIMSGETKEIYLPKYSVPGSYNFSAKKGSLKSEAMIEVLAVQNIAVDFDDGFLVLSNEGNVVQKSENVLNAGCSGKVYNIPIGVHIMPGEKQRFNLKENLPGGKYELKVNLGNVSHVLKEVYIEDNRPLSKKISQGLGSITGKAVINTEDKSNFFVFVVVLVFASLIVFFVVKSKLKTGFDKQTNYLVGTHKKTIGGLKESLDEERKLKKEMQGLFEKYVGEEVLEFSKKKGYGMEKKNIAVLFTDMRGFSKLFDSFDALEVTRILNMYFKSTNEIIKMNRGFINKFVGDSVMALFNAPKEEKDFVLRAVRSGIKIRGEIARVNARLRNQGLNEIEIGIGIDCGKAAVGALGSREKTEYTAIGVPVNIAFRLQSDGVGNQILITQRVYELLKEKIEVEYIGEMNFKNISGAIKVYNVIKLNE